MRVDTTAEPGSRLTPSSAGQQRLLEQLADELQSFGLRPDLRPGLLLTRIPPSSQFAHAPAIGFIAHVDTSPEVSGAGVNPVTHRNYDGRDLRFDDDASLVLRASEQPALAAKHGHDIVTASGLTLLGADDKAGVAIVMSLAERLVRGDHPHGPVSVAFTTDEEIGRGADGFDLEAFGATVAYTLDGGELGELETENFNADGVTVTFTGFNTHPGYAKDKLANAIRALGEFLSKLPRELSPERTSHRDGFVHPHSVEGGVERASTQLIIRDFDEASLDAHAQTIETLARDAAAAVTGVTASIARTHQYRNMRGAIDREPRAAAFAEEAMQLAGVTPVRKAIRGGTDGARLSAMGLPTPNLFSGQHNIHSRLEWVSVQDMEKAVDVCLRLCGRWASG